MPEEVEYDERIEKMIESGEAYEVEKILDKRRSINGIWLYKVQWKGYPNQDTWEPVENLNNCDQLVKTFNDQRRAKAEEAWNKRRLSQAKLAMDQSFKSQTDREFWQMADEGRLPVNSNEPVYESVKKRKQSTLNRSQTNLQNGVKSRNGVDNEKETTEVVEQTNSLLSINVKRSIPFDDETKKKMRKIETTVQKIFTTVMGGGVDDTVDCSKNDDPETVSIGERLSLSEEFVSVHQQPKTRNKKSRKIISSAVNRNLVDSPIDWTIPSYPATVKNKKDKSKLKPLENNNVSPINIVNENDAITKENNDAVNSTPSPDLPVNIDVYSNEGESSGEENNFSKNNETIPAGSKSKETQDTQDNCIELCKSSEKTNLSKSEKLMYLKNLQKSIQRKIRRIKRFVFPITYIPSEEEKIYLWNSLKNAMVLRDINDMKLILKNYRSVDLGLDDCFVDDQNLLMTCASTDCQSDHDVCAMMKLLIEYGADPNLSVPENGQTALMFAAQYGFICKLKILLNFKINIDSTNNIDESALFLAIRRCPEETAVEVVKCLLMFGADYNLFNSSGKNSLDIAKHLKKPQLVEAINVYVEDLNKSFSGYLKTLTGSSSIIIGEDILPVRCLHIKDDGCWTYSFHIKELILPSGYGVCLFLASANCNPDGVTYSYVDEIPVKEVVLNENILSSVLLDGNKNVLWLEPLQCGNNVLVIKIKQIYNTTTRLIIRANLITYQSDVSCCSESPVFGNVKEINA